MEHRAYDPFDTLRQNLSDEWAACTQWPLRVFEADDGLGENDSLDTV